MSKNYQNYSKPNNQATKNPVIREQEIAEAKTMEPEQAIEETEVQAEPTQEEVVVAEPVVEEKPAKVKKISGVVIDCKKLRVRKTAGDKSRVVTMINVGSKVEIDESKSSKEFYKVHLADGTEGFCMKKFIEINQ